METIAQNGWEVDEVLFQQDNDSKHTSKLAKEFFEEAKITALDWPAQSPDLNPIEHIWALMKKKLGRYESPPRGMLELWERIQKTWSEEMSNTVEA